jgi:hypothetical protein
VRAGCLSLVLVVACGPAPDAAPAVAPSTAQALEVPTHPYVMNPTGATGPGEVDPSLGFGRPGDTGHEVALSGGRQPVPQARLSLGPVTVSGGLSQAVIRRRVAPSLARIRTCYQLELHARPTVARTVLIDLTIDPQGAVQAATPRALADEPLERCVAAALRTLAFPAPGGVVQVTIPLELRPG